MKQHAWAPAATLYLSGGGLGARADAWPEALDWLAARAGGVAFASLASNDTTQARVLQALLAARGERAEVLSADADGPESAATIFLCGGDATLLAGDRDRAEKVRRWLDDPSKCLVADSASAMALGARAASCTCDGHPIRVVDGLDLLGGLSVLAHATGGDDPRLTALGNGPLLGLPTGAAVEWRPDGDFPRLPWSRATAVTVRGGR
jgi:hypothetical protein